MDSWVVASSPKLNLHRYFALSGQMDSQVSTQVHTSCKNKHSFKATDSVPCSQTLVFYWLIGCQRTCVDLGWVVLTNLHWLLCKFDLDQSEHKSPQGNASACKAWPNRVASGPKFSTCVYLQVHLASALQVTVYVPCTVTTCLPLPDSSPIISGEVYWIGDSWGSLYELLRGMDGIMRRMQLPLLIFNGPLRSLQKSQFPFPISPCPHHKREYYKCFLN